MNKLVLGTVQFGVDYGINNNRGQVPKNEVFSILTLARKNQINLLDTAPAYGKAEKIIGEYLKKNPGKFKIISKLPKISDYCEISKSIDQSLGNLNIDRLYAYLIHDFNTIKKMPDLVKYLKKNNRIKKIGFSLYRPEELAYLLENKIEFDIIQVPYNIFDQRFGPYFQNLKDKNIEIHTRSVFLQGLFFVPPQELTRNFKKISGKIRTLRNLGQKNNLSIGSLCLNFTVLNNLIDKIIIGVDNLKNLEDNLKSLEDKKKVAKIYTELANLKENDENIILPINWKKKMIPKIKVLAIIQARTGATRLPGKSVLKILGKPMVERVIDRVAKSKLIDEIIVATTLNKEDLQIVKICADKGIRIYCGSENDVLDRFYQAAKNLMPKNIVRITGDCPIIDPVVIDKVIRFHLSSRADYTSNVLKETFPDGEDVEIFKFSALKEAALKAKLASEREHVTLYIRNNPGKYKLKNVENSINLSSKRWTVDNKEDFKFITKLYQSLGKTNEFFGMKETLKFLSKHPNLEKINHHIERNLGLKKSLKEDKIIN